jgi:hypothetical protein
MPILHWLDRDKYIKAAELVPYRLLEADDMHSSGEVETPNMGLQAQSPDFLRLAEYGAMFQEE